MASNGILYFLAYCSAADPAGAWMVSFLQPEKALRSISVTPAGMVTLVRFLQPLKASPQIFLTPAGMVTLVSFAQLHQAGGQGGTGPAGQQPEAH